MTLLNQLAWGAAYLSVCLVLETAILVACASALKRLAARFQAPHRPRHNAAILLVAIGYIVLAHTLQVWIWASAFVWVGAIADWNTALYFSLVTYTSLGYGDVVLGPGLRIFAAFAAVTGLLGFGISTAFLVSATGRIFAFGAASGPRS